jgi:hypothetical protein
MNSMARAKGAKVEQDSDAVPLPVAGDTEGADPGVAAEHEEIARLAYSYWEARGGEGGSAEEDWLRAEEELKARLAQSAE